MDTRVADVVRGYLNLNNTERSEFASTVNEYIHGNEQARDRIVREARGKVIKMDLGPVGSPCTCCGR